MLLAPVRGGKLTLGDQTTVPMPFGANEASRVNTRSMSDPEQLQFTRSYAKRKSPEYNPQPARACFAAGQRVDA